MSEKIAWTELRKQLAERAGVSEKDAQQFLTTLTENLIEGLKTDKQVKLNGLGTFRLQPVAPRKSVNVATGESFTIEGYNKVAFAPEAGVKELLQNAQNSPATAADETTPLRKLGEQANEIVDILAELGQAPVTTEEAINETEEVEEDIAEEEVAEEEVAEEEIAEEETAEEETAEEETEEEETEEEVTEEVTEEPMVEEKETTPIVEEEPKVEELKVEDEVTEASEDEEEKPSHTLRNTLIVLLLLGLLAGCAYFFLRDKLVGLLERFTPELTIGKQPEVVPADTIAPEIEEPEPEYDLTDLITVEEMHEASRLTWMAYRYYGAKELWVFIYAANKENIPNPNNIEVGTPIRVPRLSEELKNVDDPHTQELIQQLRQELGLE